VTHVTSSRWLGGCSTSIPVTASQTSSPPCPPEIRNRPSRLNTRLKATRAGRMTNSDRVMKLVIRMVSSV
jgi:hypothetical protein